MSVACVREWRHCLAYFDIISILSFLIYIDVCILYRFISAKPNVILFQTAFSSRSHSSSEISQFKRWETWFYDKFRQQMCVFKCLHNNNNRNSPTTNVTILCAHGHLISEHVRHHTKLQVLPHIQYLSVSYFKYVKSFHLRQKVLRLFYMLSCWSGDWGLGDGSFV